MKIAVLSPVPFLPATQGNTVRIDALTRALRTQGHEVWVVLLCDPPDLAPYHAAYGADRVITLPAEARVPRFLRRLNLWLRRRAGQVLHLPGRHYRRLDDLYQSRWTPHLRRLQVRIGFDAVCTTYVHTSAALDAFPDDVLKLIDTHDAFAEAHVAYRARGVKWFFYSLRTADECRGFRRADVILAIQAEEAARFRHQLDTHPAGRAADPAVAVVSHIHDESTVPAADHTPCRALFLGSRNAANLRGAQVFVTQVLPLITARLPEFRLVMAGDVCTAIPDHPHVIKLGRVDNVADAFAAAPILVNPVAMGTGINIKMLDAMAAGVPAVSTPMGLRGLPQTCRDFVIEVPDDDPQAFADALVALVPDTARRRALGARARAQVASWNAAQTGALARSLAQTPRCAARSDAPAVWPAQIPV
ncbi:Glycosyltransferase involved in cell wall bisynthesis [Loktanella fryxellensis]|uniref:Glycosyltransferase involved in cell wall bisynthesis n=1 Tax=Loktanella fryxellensis TaxID=245187 RepID=A0A1H8H734_9RHOB|nr:glycosyltransferase [Loktanella fryxellensis]SEN51547.1 Glycosyltransferase involved in cell wall bisynthesis [Loktanella fryxellensis]